MTLKRLRLSQRRKALGFTQEQLAERLGCERSTVIRWERAETEPQPWLRPKLCQLLKLTAEELADLLAEVTDVPTHRDGFAVVSSVPADFALSTAYTVRVMEGFTAHDIASRREALAQLAVLTGAALVQPVKHWVAALTAPPIGPAEVGTDEVTELEQAVTLFRRWDASGAGGLRRKAIVGQLNAVAETLNASHPPGITRRLFQVTAELAQLAGWMAYDQGLFGTAQRYYLLALHACRESACPELGAKVIGDMTQMSTALGNYDDSLNLVQAALSGLPPSGNNLVRSELLGLQARAYAQLDPVEAGQAVRAAETCLAVYEEAPSGDGPDWLHYMNMAEVECLAANAYIELALNAEDGQRWQSHTAEAETHCLRACQGRDGAYTRSRIFDELRLAKVRLGQREPIEAAAVGQHALQLAAGIRSSLIVDWLIRFNGKLRDSYPSSVAVGDFSEQLSDYIRLAAPARTGDL